MKRFEARLVSGRKPPYDTWTFVVIPAAIRAQWSGARVEVRGTIGGEPFRGTVSRGEGVHRVPVTKRLLARIGAARGDVVEVALEPDPEPRPLELPAELRALLARDRALARRFEALAPSCRRAWAAFVGEAKRAETRARRLRQAAVGIRARVYPGQ